MKELSKYYKSLIIMCGPIILGHISHVLIGTIDVAVASRHGTDTVAAISIANSIMTCLFVIGIGLLSGITPVISNYLGSSKPSKKYIFPTINYTVIMAILFCCMTLLIIPFLDKFGFAANLIPMIKQYMLIVSFSYFGAYLHFALKEFLQSYEVLNFPNLVSIAAVFLNLFLNIAFVFGFWIIPPMGVVGLALATLTVRTLMGAIMVVYCYKSMSFGLKFDLHYTKQLLKIGYPISIAMLLEFFAFNSITLIMGRISGIYAAAQSILLSITSLTFMVPLAISNAIAIKVGFANGARDYQELKKYSLAGVIMAFVFMCICAVLLLLLPRHILGIITSDEKLIQICIPVLIVAAFYQIFDGLQIAFSGILKGLKRTLFVSIANLCGYWVVGIPIGAVLAFVYNLNLLGFWYGLALSIFTMSVVMGFTVIKMFAKLRKEYV